MAKATDTPSAHTRRFIRQAWNRGWFTHAHVVLHCHRTRKALVAFTREVEHLHLSDEGYEHVVRTSGMGGLLKLSQRMSALLAWASDEAA